MAILVSMTSRTEHNDTVCRQTRHTRAQHLITADERSRGELEMLLAALPLCATGRLFIEVPDASHIGKIAAPVRMTVTWLDRSRRSGAPGTGRGCAPGQAVSRAAIAWADEMLCADQDGTRIHLLGAYLGTADIVEHLTAQRAVGAERIHTPERFGLATAR